MKKTFPENFSSFEEYDGYIHCYNSAKIGDSVSIYLTSENRFSQNKTDNISQNIMIVGKIFDKVINELIIGSKTKIFNFWHGNTESIKDRRPNQNVFLHQDINLYNYFYFVYHHEIRFAKIIKSV